jgi:N-methylhydantoinase A
LREHEHFSSSLIDAFPQWEASSSMARLEAEVKSAAPEAEFGLSGPPPA